MMKNAFDYEIKTFVRNENEVKVLSFKPTKTIDENFEEEARFQIKEGKIDIDFFLLLEKLQKEDRVIHFNFITEKELQDFIRKEKEMKR